MVTIKEISVFVDESGSFAADEKSSRYYLVCLLLHDQSEDLSDLIVNLENAFALSSLGRGHCVHVGPLIRREGEYVQMNREQRQWIFRKMMAFVRKANISYRCFLIDKHFNDGDNAVHDKLLQDINRFLIDNAALFNAYDKLKIYYDDGQRQVTSLLREAFAMFSSTSEFVTDVKPANYRLFQAADLLCSLELIAAKIVAGEPMTLSERRFFGDEREFKRDILRSVRRKLII